MNVPTLFAATRCCHDHYDLFKPPVQSGCQQGQKSGNDWSVFITDRGRPAHVLLTFEAYKKITGMHTKIADLLAMPGIEDLELDIPKLPDLAQTADLS